MPKRISPWQALFRYYPNSMTDAEHAVLRVHTVRGLKQLINDRPQVRAEIARRIGMLEQKILLHNQIVAARSHRAYKSSTSSTAADEDSLGALAVDLQASMFSGNNDDLSDVEDLFDDIANEKNDPSPTILHSMPILMGVSPQRINLIDMGNGQAQAEVYPLTFRCPSSSCGHFQVADPNKGLPTCPCCLTCKECRKTFSASKSQRCPHCGSVNARQTPLRQLSVIEICSRCALVRQIFPHALRLRPEDWVGRPVRCPKCNIGHIHLKRGFSLADARFVCTHGCHYERWEAELGGECPECSVRKDANNADDKGDKAFMKPAPAVASSNLQPLVESFLFLGSEEANLKSLREGFKRHRDEGYGGWSVGDLDADTVFPQKSKAARKICGIDDAFTLSGIRTTTVNYGYWSRAQEHKRPIKDEDRLHRFYRGNRNDPNYDVYFVETEGHGLIIALDQARLLGIVNEATGANFASYNDLVEAALFQLRGDNPPGQIVFQDLIDPEKVAHDHGLTLVRLMHSLEHAVLAQAEEQVGLQIFGSKLLLRDATIVLYEQEDVGDGGINQLVSGTGFLKLMRSVRNQLAVCEQDCETGCPACNYGEDAKCRPFVPHEFEEMGVRWVPPNALLDRVLAYRYLETCNDG